MHYYGTYQNYPQPTNNYGQYQTFIRKAVDS